MGMDIDPNTDVLMELLQEEPVQEGSQMYADSTGKVGPPVSLHQDYIIAKGNDCFMSSAAPPQMQQEDLLNKVVGSNSLHPVPTYQRSDSINELFADLQKDSVDGSQPQMQTEEGKVPYDLQDVEISEISPGFENYFDWQQLDADQQLQMAISEDWPQSQSIIGTGSSTSNTSMALTYEVPQQPQQQVTCTQQPQLPCLKEEQPQQEPQLPYMLHVKEEKTQPQEQQQQQHPKVPNLGVFGSHCRQQVQQVSEQHRCNPPSLAADCSSISELESTVGDDRSSLLSPREEEQHELWNSNELMAVRLAEHIKEKLSELRRPSQDSKPQVHEVVLCILLHQLLCGCHLPMEQLLAFCDKDGNPSNPDNGHFQAKDTKLMGSVWQKLKGNKNGNFDTFARAMRVGREREKGFFDYLESGKGSKKRLYRLGNKCDKEMKWMLRHIQSDFQP